MWPCGGTLCLPTVPAPQSIQTSRPQPQNCQARSLPLCCRVSELPPQLIVRHGTASICLLTTHPKAVSLAGCRPLTSYMSH